MKNIEAIKNSPVKVKSQHAFRKKVLVSQLAISLASLPLISQYSFAQSSSTTGTTGTGATCSSPSNSCLDLYQGTLAAIQQYNYQPIGNGGLTAQWSMQSFNGGTLSASPMVISVPSGQGTPTNQVLTSTLIYNCPANAKASTGTITVTATVSDTIEISSTTQVMNSSSSFNSNSASVGIQYSTPNTPYGSASASFDYTYEWGSSYEQQTTTGGGTSVNNATASEYSYVVNYSVAPGQYQYVQITDSIVKYDGANWTSNVTLSGDISNNTYAQSFKNTIAPTNANFSIPSGPDKGIIANVWLPPKTWTSANGDQMASPNGAFAFFPNQNDYLTSLYWTGPNSAQWGYSQGTSAYGPNAGMNFEFKTASGNTNNLIGYVPSNPSNPFWYTGPGIAYLGLLDVGYLTAYDPNWNVIWTSAKYWTPPAASNPRQTMSSITPSQVLPNNGQAFTATGTYNSTTYNANATVGVSSPQPMTQDMINQYCSIYYSDSSQTKDSMSASRSNSQGFGFVNVQNVRDQNTKGIAEQIPPAVRNSSQNSKNPSINQAIPNNPQVRNDVVPNNIQQNVVGGGAGPDKSPKPEVREKIKAVKIKGPLTLKTNQFYVANLSGLKVSKVVVHSDDLNSFVGFVADKGDGVTLADTKQVRLKIGQNRKYSVQGK